MDASLSDDVVSGSDFEDEEEEPKLRYHRLGGSLTELLKRDTARHVFARLHFRGVVLWCEVWGISLCKEIMCVYHTFSEPRLSVGMFY